MKKLLINLLMVFVFTSVYAQDEISFGTYIWKTNVPMRECNRNGKIINDEIVDSESGQRFRIVDFSEKKDSAIIMILPYTTLKNKIPS